MRTPVAGRALQLTGTAVGSFVLGIGLAALGAFAGPLAVVVPVAVAGLVIAALARPALALLVPIAAMPTATMSLAGPLQAIDVATIAGIGAVWIALLNRGEAPLGWAPAMWGAVGIAVMAAVSTASAVDANLAFRQDLLLGVGLLLVGTLLVGVRDLDDVNLVVGGLVAVGAVMCALALRDVSEIQAKAGGALVANRAEGLLGQPNHLGGFAAIVLLLACGLTLSSRTRTGRALAGLAAMPALAALGLSLSRGAWMGGAFGIVAFIVLLRDVRRRAVLLAVPLLALALAFTAVRADSVQIEVVRSRLSTIADGGSGPYDNRPAIWAEARRQIVESPLTGQGPGGFPVASAKWRSEVNAGAWHAHNVLLTVAAEAGIPAAVALVAFTMALAREALRSVRRLGSRRHRAIVAGVAAALSTFIAHGLVDFTFRQPVLFTMSWMLVGLLLASARFAPAPPVPARAISRV